MTKIIPEEVLLSIEKELEYMNFGKICLEILLHDKIPRYRIIKEISIIPGKATSGSEQSNETSVSLKQNNYKKEEKRK